MDSPLIYYTNEVHAVVSTGRRDRWIELAAPDPIIGGVDDWGIQSWTCRVY